MSQSLIYINISDQTGLNIDSITVSDGNGHPIKRRKPVLSFLLDEKMYTTNDVYALKSENGFLMEFESKVKLLVVRPILADSCWQSEFVFENISNDTVILSNVIPFGCDSGSVNIMRSGPPDDLVSARLFRPGYDPVRVILPYNAWELGYTSFPVQNGLSICAMARRHQVMGGLEQRDITILPPKAIVNYKVYAETFNGEWQEGLKLMFRDKYLHDLEKFDNTLYERDDLGWIRESYIVILQMAWDREFYDRTTGKYTLPEVFRKGNEIFGNIDVYGIWPTWPLLGLDQRDQQDLYNDLPGGTVQLRNYSRLARQSNTKFFIAYHPDYGKKEKEGHDRIIARLVREIEADGVILDSKSSSDFRLQATADSVRKGVIMYSEGMAAIKDMQRNISGRVGDSIFLSPELNLNKLIKPDFAIFRVCDVGEDVIHREIAISFFNGYGTELNMFRPGGKDDKYRDDLEFLARTTFILRQNNDSFLDKEWTPLIETTVDKTYVNTWESGEKKIYTVLNMNPEGVEGRLFEVSGDSLRHFVSLWSHENIIPVNENGITYISANAEGWPDSYSGTRKEGSVDCIAELPLLLRSEIKGDSLVLEAGGENRIVIWKGNPSYKTDYKEFIMVNDTIIRVRDLFGYYEGKIVVQVLNDKHLVDENILLFKGGAPWIVSVVVPTVKATGIAPNMILIPGTKFSYDLEAGEDFIQYPDVSGRSIDVDSFLIDKYPVTNAQYYDFLQSSGYRPSDTSRYLRHWEMGIYKPGQEKYPVVYLSYEDMRAYARWAGKRLPTQAEWQLAAQGTDERKWPWGNEFHGTLCNNGFGKPTPVDAFNKGMSPYGVVDLVGNVWQMMNDMYFNGSYYFTIIRGGSYYKPDTGSLYLLGGPQPLDRTQMMLMVSQGFDRNATVGFRCVKDIDRDAFRSKGNR
jgi:formylglycine-generating enzyme required for sulfatase activity